MLAMRYRPGGRACYILICRYVSSSRHCISCHQVAWMTRIGDVRKAAVDLVAELRPRCRSLGR
jgi:hypothetical protein